MQSAIRTVRRSNLTKNQKSLSTLANVNSAVGHTGGIFGGIATGVNVSKAMNDNGINSGVSAATGVVSAIAIIAGVSIATEYVSGAIRKKAGVPNPFAMLCQNDFDPEEFESLFGDIQEEEDDSEDDDNALTENELVGES